MIAGLSFETRPNAQPVAIERADVACFIGFVRRRTKADLYTLKPVPGTTVRWLYEQGWVDQPMLSETQQSLRDLPVPLSHWDDFLSHFDPRRQLDQVDAQLTGSVRTAHLQTQLRAWSDLALAVRAFFEQGGQRCYVLRVGEPWPLRLNRDATLRHTHMSALLPGWDGQYSFNVLSRSTWVGLSALVSLPDVSFVAMPDLCACVSSPGAPLMPASLPLPEPQFGPCDEVIGPRDQARALVPMREPRVHTVSQMAQWRRAVSMGARFISQYRPDVQLVCALPLLSPDLGVGQEVMREDALFGWHTSPEQGGIASAFVQLAWPWCRWAGSVYAAGDLTAPDGHVLGVLAKNAITRGAHRSAGGQVVDGIISLEPSLTSAIERAVPPWPVATAQDALIKRVSLLGQSTQGTTLRSDVTASRQLSWQPACINRMFNALLRLARRVGDDLVFEANGPATWALARQSMSALLEAFWREGALRGSSVSSAFEVRCDASTHTQSDLDAGRLMCEVRLRPSHPIEQLAITLSMTASGGPDPRQEAFGEQ